MLRSPRFIPKISNIYAFAAIHNFEYVRKVENRTEWQLISYLKRLYIYLVRVNFVSMSSSEFSCQWHWYRVWHDSNRYCTRKYFTDHRSLGETRSNSGSKGQMVSLLRFYRSNRVGCSFNVTVTFDHVKSFILQLPYEWEFRPNKRDAPQKPIEDHKTREICPA